MRRLQRCTAERSYPMFEVRGCGREELPKCQGRWLRGATPHPRSGAGAALCWSKREEIPHIQGKRNPSKTVGVGRRHQRANRLKPQSRTTSNLITQTTALSNSMKLSYAVWGHPRVMVERSDRMQSTEEGNGKPLQYPCLENPMKVGH